MLRVRRGGFNRYVRCMTRLVHKHACSHERLTNCSRLQEVAEIDAPRSSVDGRDHRVAISDLDCRDLGPGQRHAPEGLRRQADAARSDAQLAAAIAEGGKL